MILVSESTCHQHIYQHKGKGYLVREWDASGNFWVLRENDTNLEVVNIAHSLHEAQQMIVEDAEKNT